MFISRIISVFKIIFYKIRFKGRLKISIFSLLNYKSKIYVQNSNITMGKKITMKDNTKVIAVANAKVSIGSGMFINYNSIIVSRYKISIGDKVIIGPNVCIYDHDHKFGKDGVKEGFNLSEIVIEDNVWIGAGSIILRGTHIGKNSIIGAGCVIKGDIPANSIVKANRNNTIEKLREK